MSYGIAKKHNAMIEVHSQMGIETTLTLRLPIIGDAEKETRYGRNS